MPLDIRIIDVPNRRWGPRNKYKPLLEAIKSLPEGKAVLYAVNGKKALSARARVLTMCRMNGIPVASTISEDGKSVAFWRKGATQ